MADPDPINYVVLTAAERANLIRDRLKQLETEYERLRIMVSTPVTGQASPADSTRLAEVAAAVRRLQGDLAQVEQQAAAEVKL